MISLCFRYLHPLLTICNITPCLLLSGKVCELFCCNGSNAGKAGEPTQPNLSLDCLLTANIFANIYIANIFAKEAGEPTQPNPSLDCLPAANIFAARQDMSCAWLSFIAIRWWYHTALCQCNTFWQKNKNSFNLRKIIARFKEMQIPPIIVSAATDSSHWFLPQFAKNHLWMDVAPWCYKWGGLGWKYLGGVRYRAPYGADIPQMLFPNFSHLFKHQGRRP